MQSFWPSVSKKGHCGERTTRIWTAVALAHVCSVNLTACSFFLHGQWACGRNVLVVGSINSSCHVSCGVAWLAATDVYRAKTSNGDLEIDANCNDHSPWGVHLPRKSMIRWPVYTNTRLDAYTICLLFGFNLSPVCNSVADKLDTGCMSRLQTL